MYKIVAFDLDDTLTPAKLPADVEMIDLLWKLLEKTNVAIITWGKFETINMQIISHFKNDNLLKNLYILPTIWTKMYTYESWTWDLKYKDDLSEDEVKHIKNVLEKAIRDLNLIPGKVWGEIVENRWSQITYSALWQKAPLEEKKKYDKDRKKRMKIIDYIKDELKDFSIWIWWTTSIDITKKWMDKSYWIEKLLTYLNFNKKDILFVWDALFEWWNDYPVKKLWIETIQVSSPQDTKILFKKLIS